MQQMSIEIDQQTDLQLSQNLRFEDGIDSFHALSFYNNRAVDNQINPISDGFSTILNWRRNLPVECNLGELQFRSESRFVNGFPEAGPKLKMNFHRIPHDSPRAILAFHNRCDGANSFPLRTSVSPWPIFFRLQAGMNPFRQGLEIRNALHLVIGQLNAEMIFQA